MNKIQDLNIEEAIVNLVCAEKSKLIFGDISHLSEVEIQKTMKSMITKGKLKIGCVFEFTDKPMPSDTIKTFLYLSLPEKGDNVFMNLDLGVEQKIPKDVPNVFRL